MKILVTGGSGYIGSFMVRRLSENFHEIVVFDRNESQFPVAGVTYIKGDLCNWEDINNLLNTYSFESIIHFAGVISMGESMKNPYKYFENNTRGSLILVEAAVKHNINKIIFSSTAGVYGNPEFTPIPEDHQKNPTNPYGESKLFVERILKWYYEILGLSSVSLRYFNACGALPDGSIGENHIPESHIIPSAIHALFSGTELKLYGTDYDTLDGTAVRDYIHVIDLVEAHVLALEKLKSDSGAFIYNVGTGFGHTNREIITMIEMVSGKKLFVKEETRRAGDADILVADVTRINRDLGFRAKYSDLKTIISSALKWHESQL